MRTPLLHAQALLEADAVPTLIALFESDDRGASRSVLKCSKCTLLSIFNNTLTIDVPLARARPLPVAQAWLAAFHD